MGATRRRFIIGFSAVAVLLSTPAIRAGTPQRADGLYAEIHTNRGTIVARLEADKTPLAVANFVGLAEGTIANDAFAAGTPYYDGSLFHRVVPGHVIQAGAPAPDLSSARGPGYTFPDEIHADLSHDHAGALGMAKGDPHTNGAQFYVTLDDRSYLDGSYIVFGEVIDGLEVVDRIVEGDVIDRVRIVRVGGVAGAYRPDTAMFRRLVQAAEARVESDNADRRRLEREYVDLNYPGDRIGSYPGVQRIVQRSGDTEWDDGERVPVRYVGTALRYRGHMLAVTGPLFEEIRFAGSPADGAPQASDLNAGAFDYQAGVTSLPAGLDGAIRAMRRGAREIVIVPAAQAYGSRGFYGPNVPGERRFVIPADTMIVYAVEVLAR